MPIPNLSSLALEEKAEIDALFVTVPPLTLEKPQNSADENRLAKEYEESLYGTQALLGIADAVERDDLVIVSTGKVENTAAAPREMYKTFDGTLAIHTKEWWRDWIYAAPKRLIGEGSWNQAWLVKDLSMLGDAFEKVYNQKPPQRGMIVRIGKNNPGQPVPKRFFAKEMVTAAYARANGIGPQIYAQFYLVKDDLMLDELHEANRLLNPDSSSIRDLEAYNKKKKLVFGRANADLKGNVRLTCTITEAWQGDCKSKLGESDDAFEPDDFATKFVDLCQRAAKVGFWHMDVKRANMLWRQADDKSLELCFTDFDPFFCKILSPQVRTATENCCIAATVACMLGEVRCNDENAWKRYAPSVGEAMAKAGVDINQITDQQMCTFLAEVQKKRGRADSVPEFSEEKRLVAQRFRNHLDNYILSQFPGECLEIDKSKPLFPQVLEYALSEPEPSQPCCR
jgi:hypothetical protein